MIIETHNVDRNRSAPVKLIQLGIGINEKNAIVFFVIDSFGIEGRMMLKPDHLDELILMIEGAKRDFKALKDDENDKV